MILVSFDNLPFENLSEMLRWAESEEIKFDVVKAVGNIDYYEGVAFYIDDPDEQILFKLRFGYGKC